MTGKRLKGPTKRDLEELPFTSNPDGSISVKVEL
jgi:hypothetical protein